jgi:hypothetical protein
LGVARHKSRARYNGDDAEVGGHGSDRFTPGSEDRAVPYTVPMKAVQQQCCTAGANPSSTFGLSPRWDMLRSARLFLCVRCRAQVLLCSHCDRGQLYCTRACSLAGRRERRRHTAKCYQDSRGGRLKHAARAACWRKRRRSLRQAGAAIDVDKVTHQGCPPSRTDASLLACDTINAGGPITLGALSHPAAPVEPASLAITALAAPLCRRCACVLLPHVRVGWLHGRGIRRRERHDHPC